MQKNTRGSQEEEEGKTTENMFAFLGIAYKKHPFKSFCLLQLKCSYRPAAASGCSLLPHASLKKCQFSTPERGQKLCCFLNGHRENHLPFHILYSLFCLVLYLDEQPNANLPSGTGDCFWGTAV